MIRLWVLRGQIIQFPSFKRGSDTPNYFHGTTKCFPKIVNNVIGRFGLIFAVLHFYHALKTFLKKELNNYFITKFLMRGSTPFWMSWPLYTSRKMLHLFGPSMSSSITIPVWIVKILHWLRCVKAHCALNSSNHQLKMTFFNGRIELILFSSAKFLFQQLILSHSLNWKN